MSGPGLTPRHALGPRVRVVLHADKKKAKKSKERSAPQSVGDAQLSGDFSIKPEDVAARLDTSKWPLLLKNYDKLNVRTGHFTPIPSGCSPLKRPFDEYIKFVGGLDGVVLGSG